MYSIGWEVVEQSGVVRGEAWQRAQEGGQEGVSEGGEVHAGHRVRRAQRLLAHQRSRPARSAPTPRSARSAAHARQQHRQEFAQELRPEYHLQSTKSYKRNLINSQALARQLD